jgi:hypothetical protein
MLFIQPINIKTYNCRTEFRMKIKNDSLQSDMDVGKLYLKLSHGMSITRTEFWNSAVEVCIEKVQFSI